MGKDYRHDWRQLLDVVVAIVLGSVLFVGLLSFVYFGWFVNSVILVFFCGGEHVSFFACLSVC